jgi:hypothetical protein
MRPLLIGIVLSIFPLLVNAQFETSGFVDNTTSVVLEPTFPSPETVFTATLNDYGGDGFGATIEWYYNDTKLDWATNRRSIELTAPKAGDLAEIQVILSSPSGSVQKASQTITPLYLDIILEPQTHTPSFYKGRALPTPDSTVNATVLLSNPSPLQGEYLYTWRFNNTVIQGGPLRNINRVSFTMSQDSFPTLSVTVSELNGTIIARRSIAIPNVAPRLLFYEVNTLYGIRPVALRDPFEFLGNSTTLRAVPYNLDSGVYNNPSVSLWRIDGNEVPNGSNPYEITLEKTSSNTRARVEFRVQSTTKLLQGTSGSLSLDIL